MNSSVAQFHLGVGMRLGISNVFFSYVFLTALVIGIFPGKSEATEFTIDGVLQEAKWQQAVQFSSFRITAPLTMDVPLDSTVVRVFSGDRGIYIAFSNQSISTDSRQKTTLRDADIRADYNEVIIDFDGTGGRAYGFKISRNNAIQDSVWSSSAEEKVDWDGAWQHAVAEIDGGWVSEFYIPWAIVPRAKQRIDSDTIKIYFSRWDHARQQRSSFPAIDRDNIRFFNGFHRFDVNREEKPSLDIYPYFRANYSKDNHDSNYKSGIDIFWKPSSQRQLNIAINPDFGQVESDELVVNFSAIETFFTEKRPFYFENHDLFDLRGPESLRLVHTPRIGSAPSLGEAEGSEIDYAARYVSLGQRWDYGLLTSSESDEKAYKGRDFSAARIQYKSAQGNFGALQTLVNNTAIGRKASVSAVDFKIDYSDTLSLSGQLIRSRITDNSSSKPISPKASTDSGYWLSTQYTVADVWQQELTLFNYGRNLEINDFGFVKRVNRKQLEYETEYSWPDLVGSRYLRDVTAGFEFEYKENTQGDRLPTQIGLDVELTTLLKEEIELSIESLSAGLDDLLTRGNNPVKIPEGYALEISYQSPDHRDFQYKVEIATGVSGLDKHFSTISVGPSYQLGNHFNLALEMQFENQSSWLLWSEANNFSEYKKKEFSLAMQLAAVFNSRHELRIKLESVALRASRGHRLTASTNGLISEDPDDTEAAPFSIGEFALQLRYRYTLGPLSDLFLVYSRGGEIEDESLQKNYTELMRSAARTRDDESILFKVKFHF